MAENLVAGQRVQHKLLGIAGILSHQLATPPLILCGRAGECQEAGQSVWPAKLDEVQARDDSATFSNASERKSRVTRCSSLETTQCC